jgi:DNA modification methylase/ParB-like chromosome segregation protein Spo0J
MKTIPASQLIANELTSSLYLEDEAFERFLMSIELFGILEPLKVFEVVPNESYQVVSGNRRLRAARALNIVDVPCILCEPMVISTDLVRAHQEQRVKKRSEILLEITALYEQYGRFLKQGKKSESEEVNKARKFRDGLHLEIGGKHVSQHLRTYEKRARELAKGDKAAYKREIEALDRAKSLSGALKSQENRLAKSINEKARVDFKFEIVPNAEVKVASSNQLIGIRDESVNLIYTSPPYFQMRDYGNGQSELGQETTVEEFIKNLAHHFDDCKRVLAKDGTLWVNLMDTCQEYHFQLVPEKFALAMVERGWLLHDKQIWLKSNAQWQDLPRSLPAHEYIYVFKKSPFIKFNDTWVREYTQEDGGGFTYGKEGSNVKLRSIIDYRDGVVKVPTANNANLAQECHRKGIRLTHSATFPVTLPLIAIMSCTEPGDLIIDCFAGTSTTGEGVLRVGEGRRYIGYELNLEYAMQSNVRLKKTANDLESQGLAA